MLEHRMTGERTELSGNTQHHRLRIHALKLDLALAEICFNAGQRSEKVIIPECTAEFAVGDSAKANLFLSLDDGRDFAILDRFQFGSGDFALFPSDTRFLERPRAQKTADVIQDRKSTRLNSSHLGLSSAV